MMDAQLYAYVNDPIRETNVDFSASSLAVHTTCTSIGQRCFQDIQSFGYNCSALFQGNMDTNSYATQSFASASISGIYPVVSTWFADSNMSILFEPDTGRARDDFTHLNPNITHILSTSNNTNPFHAFVAGNFAATDDTLKSTFSADPSFFIDLFQVFYVLDCQVSLHNLHYSYVNGRFSHGNRTLPESHDTSALLVQTAFSRVGNPTDFGNLIADGAYRSSLLNSTSSFISSFATQFSVALLAEMAIVLVPQLNTAEQIRSEILVVRVPLAPLWTLVALCLLCFVFGIGFTVFGVVNNSVASKDVRERLGIPGIAANWCRVPRFGNTGLGAEKMFYGENGEKKEVQRVGIVRTESDKWVFKTWN